MSLVFEADSQGEVETALKAFLMVEAGLLDTRLLTLGPWTMFEALFDKAHLS